MQMRLVRLLPALLVCLPAVGFAGEDVQVRLEKSLRDASSLTNVEIEFLDTLWMPKGIWGTNQTPFSRTLQYSYIASGERYRATSKLISGSETNLMKLHEAAFDGKQFVSYDGDNRYMTRSKENSPRDNAEVAYSPLVAPFLFLTPNSDDCLGCLVRFTEIVSGGATNAFILPKGQLADGTMEISIPGPLLQKKATSWKIAMDEDGDSFTPKTVEWISPGGNADAFYKLLNYTNLGTYRFPARIETIMSSYPPTSPPTVIGTDVVTVIAARIPNQIPDSAFKLADEEKAAVRIWDWDEKVFAKPASDKSRANSQSRPKIYDESADGSKQIAEALDIAKKEHKHVLLQFGANWCGWCYKLHGLFETNQPIAEALKNGYVVAMIDVDKEHNNDTDTKYGNPTRFGLPVIVVLDGDGKQLVTQDTGKLEDGDHHSPEKVMAFLKEWAPTGANK